MKNYISLLIATVMSLGLVACGDDGGGGGGGTTATTPQGECRYDSSARYYRYDNGDRCNYDDYYGHSDNYCYNYSYRYEGGEHRYYDHSNNRVECDPYLIDYGNVYPYSHFNGGAWATGCAYWGSGYQPVPVGNGQFVCLNPYVNYGYGGGYGGYGGYGYGAGFGAGLNLGWWFQINL